METFELYLSPIDEKQFRVINTQSGQTDSSLQFPNKVDNVKIDSRLILLRALSSNNFDPGSPIFNAYDKKWMIDVGILAQDGNYFDKNYLVNIGKKLYDSLFPSDDGNAKVRDALKYALRKSEGNNTQLHIQLKFEDDVSRRSRLADYPWELIHDGQDFLLHKQVTFSRYIAFENSPPNLPASKQLNVLLISSTAFNEDLKEKQLPEHEQKAISEALESAQKKGYIKLKKLEHATFDQLRKYLIEHKGNNAPHVVHFDGHGIFGKRCKNENCYTMHKKVSATHCKECDAELPEAQGYLAFESDEAGKPDYMSAKELGALLHISGFADGNQKSGGVALVVLSACQSAMALSGESVFNGTAQSLINHRIPAVVGMQFSVSVDAATEFAKQFYCSLGQKNSLAVAMSHGREAMDVEGNQWYRPVLYLRWKDNEGGQLFALSSNTDETSTPLSTRTPSNTYNFSGSVGIFNAGNDTVQGDQIGNQTNIYSSTNINDHSTNINNDHSTNIDNDHSTNIDNDHSTTVNYYYSKTPTDSQSHEISKSETTPETPAPNNTSPGSVTFVGRDKELEELKKIHETLDKNSTTQATFMSGIGGVGKTELAIQYARKYENDYPGGICWLDQRNEDNKSNIGEQIVEFVKTHFQLDPPGNELSNKVDYCWERWPGTGDVLVIVDNVIKYEIIEKYLKIPIKKERFKVLVITLKKKTNNDQNELINPLEPLELESALEMLKLIIGENGKYIVENEKEEAEKLCKFLGCFPLGIELVGRYINDVLAKENISLVDVNENLNKNKSAARILDKPKDGMRAELGVSAVFDLSWKQLDEEDDPDDDDFQFLGCLFGLFGQAPISWFLVKKLIERIANELNWDTDDADFLEEFGLNDLVNLSLIKSNHEEKTYQVHGIIQRFLENKLKELPEFEQIKQQFFQLMLEEIQRIPDTPIKQDLDAVRFSIPHIHKAADDMEKWLKNENKKDKDKNLTAEYKNLVDIYIGLGRFYEGDSHYNLAEQEYYKGLSIAEQYLGDFHPSYVASCLNNLGLVYNSQGQYERAEPLLLQALESSKKLLGEEHPLVAQSLNNLGLVYNSQGRYEEAEPLYNQALQIRHKLLGEEHPHTATSFNNLALVYSKPSRYAEAEPLYLQALELRKRLLGENHPHTATSLNNLAALYESQGRYLEAEPLYKQALESRKRLLGENHPDVATSLNNLATLYLEQTRYTEAEALLKQASELYKRFLGEEHPGLVIGLNNLALLYKQQGRYEESEPLYLQALEIAERNLGVNHPNTITLRENLQKLRDNR